MTRCCLALDGVSHVLPDGRALFSGLTERFDRQPTGLVGRNGVGKTLLARMLAGELQPTAGRCVRSGSVHYLAQQVSPPAGLTVAGLAGVQAMLDALGRIEAGCGTSGDFDAVGERWDTPVRLRLELQRIGLGHLDSATPVAVLSGGEAMRVALAGAFLSGADFLILDEPTNHLDRNNRQALIEQLQRWQRGVLVVSHDRQLLETMVRIVELSSLGLRSYGGNYSFYAQCKELERQHAQQQLEQRKGERQREEQMQRELRERQERRQARGNRQAHAANQAPILLGRRKGRSEVTAGKLRQQHAEARERMARRVREAAQQVEEHREIVLHPLAVDLPPQRRIAELVAVELPFVTSATRHVDLLLTGQQRVGIVGPNGCGKSTLLKVLARKLQPVAGRCKIYVEGVYLDQCLATLDPQRSVLDQMQRANSLTDAGELRMRLAQLGLDAGAITVPSGLLSGGERLKAALACALHADPPPSLLLLDEPGNHLDLASLRALECMLDGYRGALVVVSHDDAFMNQLALTHRLRAGAQGWRMEPW